MRKYFTMCDANGDGYITVEELQAFLVSLGRPVTEDEARQDVIKADKDGDGKVNWKEFVDAWTVGLIDGVNFAEVVKSPLPQEDASKNPFDGMTEMTEMKLPGNNTYTKIL